jgi:phosphoribosylanthranilate isomerase
VADLWIKICGVTTPEDARFAFDAGADAVGLNFVLGSPRRLSLDQALALVSRVKGAREWIGVFADASLDEMVGAYHQLGLGRVQLHGHEPPSVIEDLLARGIPAYQAVRIGEPEDALTAAVYGGDRILVDAKVAGQLGGTGRCVDPTLVSELSRTRRLVLAGGLGPTNVAEAVRLVHPFGVDTASGVESAPGHKDPRKVAAFVEAARGVSRGPL